MNGETEAAVRKWKRGRHAPWAAGVERDIQAALSCDGHSSARPSTKCQEHSTGTTVQGAAGRTPRMQAPSGLSFRLRFMDTLTGCVHSPIAAEKADQRLSRKLVVRQEVVSQS